MVNKLYTNGYTICEHFNDKDNKTSEKNSPGQMTPTMKMMNKDEGMKMRLTNSYMTEQDFIDTQHSIKKVGWTKNEELIN